MRSTTYLRITIGVIFVITTIMKGIWWWTVAFSALVILTLLMHFQRRLDDYALLATAGMIVMLLLFLAGLGLGAVEFLARWTG